ncbi:MAG: hypothetical protein PUC44_01850 [Eubacteriales bacterium]|nr:hypothetical protein [Eubacteriales bacterium]
MVENDGQYVRSAQDRTLIRAMTIILIQTPFFSIKRGFNPYPTGIARMEVGSMYERFTPIDAI